MTKNIKELEFLTVLLTLYLLPSVRSELTDWPCNHVIFCKPDSGILHTVQTLQLFQDSKTFVDMPLKHSVNETLAKFDSLQPDPSRAEVEQFVAEFFSEPGTELKEVKLRDWSENPEILDRIQDESYKKLVEILHERWQHLAREVSETLEEEKTSLIPLAHPFIVPGGRFREIYYWDSYWTIKGLLLSELYETVEGMLDNFKLLIERFGHIPNGNRVYYEKRSQPPLYCQMVDMYVQEILRLDPSLSRPYANYVWSMDTEFKFWIKRFRNVTIDGKDYMLASYNVEVGGPRPESYLEDYELAQKLPENKRKVWYGHMKSGAESGWDYSSRWFDEQLGNPEHPLLSVTTGDILPVDLNTILYKNAEILGKYFEDLGRADEAKIYKGIAMQLKSAIRAVLWNEDDSMWYDYNLKTNKHKREFYPSNLFPLYGQAYHETINASRVLENIVSSGVTIFPGGLPTSLYNTTQQPQQWDFPNVWPPLVEVFVTSMEELNLTESREIGREIAEKYIRNVYASAQENGTMYEKYDCEKVGKAGSGGEYGVQEGFGWSNGVSMSLLNKYPDMISSSSRISSTIVIITITLCVFNAL